MTIDTFGCLGSTIKVSAGHYVDFSNPKPGSIEIRSIAAALSKICRFGGHCPQFYSVAEHSVHAALLAQKHGCCDDAVRAVLLHDATEAYLGDMVKPLKAMNPEYAKLEQRFEAVIGEAFGVDFRRWNDEIKRFDRAMLKAEKIAMWPTDATEWVGFSTIGHESVNFSWWTCEDAEREFLRTCAGFGLHVRK